MVTNGIAVSSASGRRGEPAALLRVRDDLGREADGDVELSAELGESGLDLGVVGVGEAEPALRHRLRVRRDRVPGWPREVRHAVPAPEGEPDCPGAPDRRSWDSLQSQLLETRSPQ